MRAALGMTYCFIDPSTLILQAMTYSGILDLLNLGILGTR